MENLQFTQEDVSQLNDWAGYFAFQPNFALRCLNSCTANIIGVFSGNQMGKCLNSQEFLYTPSGIKIVSEISSGQESLGGRVTNNGCFQDDIYEITFQNGIKIKCNKEHPFYSKNYKQQNDKYAQFVPLNQLREGQYVYFESPQSFLLETKEISHAMLLGYLCSDGTISSPKQSIKFTNNNIVFLKQVENLARDGFGIISKWRNKRKGYDLFLTKDRNEKNPIRKYINFLKITNNSYGDIVNGNEDSLTNFVRGFFNGDGYLLIRRRKNGFGKLPSIEVGFCIGNSRRKAYEFQYILWKLGVYSFIVPEMMKNSKSKFYRVKVNSWSAFDIIRKLDWTKYPDKFKKAIEYLSLNPYKREKNRNWISVKKIKYCGKGLVSKISTDTGQIISYCGMKTHNTDTIVRHYVDRILGRCPIEKKNIRPNTQVRTIRFASETLPTEADEGGEVRNTVYPAFKKRLPAYLIKEDIKMRRPTIIVQDPQGGKDINIEFVSYNQKVQSQAGSQRFSVYLDEHSPQSFYQEQLPRLMAADGDLIIGLTPVEEITWEFEDIFQRAKLFFNSPYFVDYWNSTRDQKISTIQKTDSKYNIAVIRGATDDNPTLLRSAIDEKMLGYDDIATYEIRRYGIFHAITGIIYKDFDPTIHVISKSKYFDSGIPYEWIHARGIDFHPKTNWACGWITLSPQNEAFIYNEYNPSPERLVTLEISRQIANYSMDYRFKLNMVDPLAANTQVNTGLSVLDDINRYFYELRREGLGTGGQWITWDTKSMRGYDIIRERFKNSRLVGKPFSNRIVKNGVESYLPTLWILDNCVQTSYHFKNWRWENWSNREASLTKEDKNKREDKYSHFPITYECIFKHPGFTVGRYTERFVNRQSAYKGYFSARS